MSFSRADTKEMPLRMEYNPTTWRKPEGGTGSEVSQHPSDFLHTVQSYLEWVEMGQMLVNECVCACVCWLRVCVAGIFRKEDVKIQEGSRKHNALRLPRWRRIFVFSGPARWWRHTSQPSFVLQNCKSLRFNACRLTMCIVIIQASCSHHVSSDQRRVYKVKGSCKIYAYMAVSVSGKINTGRAWCTEWLSALSDWH